MNITKKQWIIIGVAFSLLIVWIIVMNRGRKNNKSAQKTQDNQGNEQKDNSLLEAQKEKESAYNTEQCALNCRDKFYQAKNSCEEKYRRRQISFADYKKCVATAGQEYTGCLRNCETSNVQS